jgi:hypothetical protein
MDSEELNDWYADHLYNEPLGGQWKQTGILAAMIGNSNPFRSAESKVFSPLDFIPVPKDPEPVITVEQSPSEQVDLAKMVHKALGGK